MSEGGNDEGTTAKKGKKVITLQTAMTKNRLSVFGEKNT